MATQRSTTSSRWRHCWSCSRCRARWVERKRSRTSWTSPSRAGSTRWSTRSPAEDLMGFLRIIAVGLVGLFAASVAASRVPVQHRLPLGAIVPGASQPLLSACTPFALEPFDPFCPGLHIHTGVDLAAHAGTPVHAATLGTARPGFDPGGAGVFVVE